MEFESLEPGTGSGDPHRGQPISTLGPPPLMARLAVILVHGRNGTPQSMLDLAAQLPFDDVAYVAPAAAGKTWYPQSFLAPMPQNEPGITSGLNVLAGLVGDFERGGVPASRVALMGFSQGACLALEFAARHARRYAAIIGLSGGLIGPPGTPRSYQGSFDATPVFLGCSDVDSHIPLARVHETADVFTRMKALVDERIYPQMSHAVTPEELAVVTQILGARP
jgi:predicted esterase